MKTSLFQVSTIFHSPKIAAILNFFKNSKHKNACILKTVLDRAILKKFLTGRVIKLSS